MIQTFKEEKRTVDDLIINRSIIKDVTIPANIVEAWEAWSTKKGLESIFASECHVELKLFGRYEKYFAPKAEPGNRGAENNMIVAVEPHKIFSFTWDAPTTMPEVRKQCTSVVIKFKKIGKDKTRILMCHSGWGDGDEWDRAFDYCSEAFGCCTKKMRNPFRTWPDRLGKRGFSYKSGLTTDLEQRSKGV